VRKFKRFSGCNVRRQVRVEAVLDIMRGVERVLLCPVVPKRRYNSQRPSQSHHVYVLGRGEAHPAYTGSEAVANDIERYDVGETGWMFTDECGERLEVPQLDPDLFICNSVEAADSRRWFQPHVTTCGRSYAWFFPTRPCTSSLQMSGR